MLMAGMNMGAESGAMNMTGLSEGAGCDEALLTELVEVLGVPVVYTFMGKVSSGLNMDARSMHCLVPHCDFHCPAQRTIDCKVG
jgi:hypothetical protein